MNPYPRIRSQAAHEKAWTLLKRQIAQPSAEDVIVVGVLLFLTVIIVEYGI